MKKIKAQTFDITVKFTWICPNCKEMNLTRFSGSPYEVIAENENVGECNKCGEMYDVSFYDNIDDE